MGVEGYDKVYTKVIEGKPKCVYKRPNGTKHYVLGFGKMRTIENYVKLCRKKAVEKAAKSKKVTKKPSTRKRYGGFFEELFTGKVDEDKFTNEKYENGEGFADPPPAPPAPKTMGGNSCNRGGLEGGKRKKKNASNKSLLKMMMAAFKNKSVKKSKSKRRHRRGGGEE
jgi:hypothetical protein